MELVQPALGFVSASLVALIALGFGAMGVFFSGSAMLVFGQFLPFVRRLPVAATGFMTAIGRGPESDGVGGMFAVTGALLIALGGLAVWLLVRDQ